MGSTERRTVLVRDADRERFFRTYQGRPTSDEIAHSTTLTEHSHILQGRWPGWSPIARVERRSSNSLYLSLGKWPRLPFTARIERPLFHRGGSASKKGTWPLLLHPS